MTGRKKAVLGAAAALLGLCGLNSSWLAPVPSAEVQWLAHRGLHQTFSLDGVDNETCTAVHIDPPTHRFLENTIPSMQAAFDAGASVVELDLHVSKDGALVVFHDATLDCRTDGHGSVEDHDLADLRDLELENGYTADGGRSWPLRGTGVGLLVTLPEVLDAFPGQRFLLHLKTDDPADGAALAAALAARSPADRHLWIVYGGSRAVASARAGVPGLRELGKGPTKACLLPYFVYGWTGVVPSACRGQVVAVPISHAGWLWGWPNRFLARMDRVGATVMLTGPLTGGPMGGVDDEATRALMPSGFGGLVWTNHVETVGVASK